MPNSKKNRTSFKPGYNYKEQFGPEKAAEMLEQKRKRLFGKTHLETIGGEGARKFQEQHKGRFGERSYHWHGGRIDDDGYILVLDPERTKRTDGRTRYIPEHRLVMEQHIGRKLVSGEIVHHIDGNKINNNIENLKLVTRKEHKLGYAAVYGDGFLAGLICGIRRGWRKF